MRMRAYNGADIYFNDHAAVFVTISFVWKFLEGPSIDGTICWGSKKYFTKELRREGFQVSSEKFWNCVSEALNAREKTAISVSSRRKKKAWMTGNLLNMLDIMQEIMTTYSMMIYRNIQHAKQLFKRNQYLIYESVKKTCTQNKWKKNGDIEKDRCNECIRWKEYIISSSL